MKKQFVKIITAVSLLTVFVAATSLSVQLCSAKAKATGDSHSETQQTSKQPMDPNVFLGPSKYYTTETYTTETQQASKNLMREDTEENSYVDEDEPKILDMADDTLKEKYDDIDITNEWLQQAGSIKNIALFGSLKSDSQQGVAETIVVREDGSLLCNRYLLPEKNGAIKVTELGATYSYMTVVDGKGLKWDFGFYVGFNASPQN